MDTSNVLKPRPKAQPTRHQQLANEACDALEPPAWREKARGEYHKWYKKACKSNLEGELKEMMERALSGKDAKGKAITNRGQYFLTAARNLLK